MRRLFRKISNYENIKHRKVRGHGADTVGGRKHCIRRRAKGGAGSGTAASRRRLRLRLGNGIEDPAESDN
jgi:hypothetical protein